MALVQRVGPALDLVSDDAPQPLSRAARRWRGAFIAMLVLWVVTVLAVGYWVLDVGTTITYGQVQHEDDLRDMEALLKLMPVMEGQPKRQDVLVLLRRHHPGALISTTDSTIEMGQLTFRFGKDGRLRRVNQASLLDSVSAARRSFPSDSAILAIITQRVDEKRSAGIVIGLLEPNGNRRIIANGDPGPGQPPLDGNSVFEIGSITKVFTGILLAHMTLAGEVKLDDPVATLLPATVKMPQRGGKPITLAHLSMHNSGLPRMPSNFRPRDPRNPYVAYAVKDLYEFLSGHELQHEPGAHDEYSNVGVGLLGHALSLKAGRSYETLQRERIWTPLGLQHTAMTLTPWMREHLALGHSPNGDVVASWDLNPTFAAAGAIRSTANDMLTFLAANLRPEQHGELGRAMAFAQALHQAPGSSRPKRLNWAARVTPNDTVVWHNGGTGGYRTWAGFVKSRGVAVVALSNTAGQGVDDIGYYLLDQSMLLAPKSTPGAGQAILTATTVVLMLGAVAWVVWLWRRTPRLTPRFPTS